MRTNHRNKGGVSRRAITAISVFAATSIALGWLLRPRLKIRGGAERLRSDVPVGFVIAAREGELYWQGRDNAVYRLPADGGPVALCFSMPDKISGFQRIVPADDGLYIIDAQTVKPAPRAESFVMTDKNAPRLGAFLPSPPRPGERRVSHTTAPATQKLRVWRFVWGGNSLQPVPVPAKYEAAPFSLGAAGTSGVYLLEQTGNHYEEVANSKGVRSEYGLNDTLIRLPFARSKPKVIARHLSNPYVTASENAVCWDKPRLYPDTRHDIVCHFSMAPDLTLCGEPLGGSDTLAATAAGIWWLQSQPDRTVRMYQRRAGAAKLERIEPPLRRSEADTLDYRWFRHVDDRLYLLCAAHFAGETSEPPHDTADHYVAPPPPAHWYLIRMNPVLAGQTGFWGKPVPLPEGADSIIMDKKVLSFTRRESDQNLLFAAQDLLSSSAPERPMQTVLYRLPLP